MGVRVSPPVRNMNMSLSKIKSFFAEVVNEIRHKITWPTYGSLQRSSMLVLVASFVFAVVIGVIDFCFRNIISWFYSTF
jgi:preprotein translocase subunit SecE